MKILDFSISLQLRIFLSKVCFFKVYSLIRGVDTKNCLGFLLRMEGPDSKKLGVMKTAKSGDFKTVNYIYVVIGRCLTVLWRFSQKNVVCNVVPQISTFFARIKTKPPKIVRLGYS